MFLSPGEGEEIFRLGFYEPGTLAFMKKVLEPGDTFLDVGASIGLMSFYASKIIGNSGRVLTFEPVSKTFTHLTKSIKLNHSKNITPLQFALGNENTSLPINLDSACPSLATVKSNSTTETVQVRILDEVLSEQKISKVKLMKIDVEGFEAEVLSGAKKLLSDKNAPMLCIEFAPALIQSSNKFEALEIIKSCNTYRFFN